MNLLIISGMPHYKKDGNYYGWGPTAEEITHLSSLFDKITHLATIYKGAPSKSYLPYGSPNVHVVELPPSGGKSFLHKFSIFFFSPYYIKTILKAMKNADIVHVRCPANISLIAIFLLFFIKHPKKRWIKYAGNWKPEGKEACSYTFQRWWLRNNFHRGHVTVNGEWKNQAPHIHSFYNPCITSKELLAAQTMAAGKEITFPLRLIFVGRIEEEKGVGRVLKIAHLLSKKKIQFQIDLIGDGPQSPLFKKMSKALGVEKFVTFHGAFSREDLNTFYQKAHLMIMPTSASEGWPKVLSEGMAYGVVPIVGAVSSIPQYLERFNTGIAIAPLEMEKYVEMIYRYTNNSKLWKKESLNAIKAAEEFTYEIYVKRIQKLCL